MGVGGGDGDRDVGERVINSDCIWISWEGFIFKNNTINKPKNKTLLLGTLMWV